MGHFEAWGQFFETWNNLREDKSDKSISSVSRALWVYLMVQKFNKNGLPLFYFQVVEGGLKRIATLVMLQYMSSKFNIIGALRLH